MITYSANKGSITYDKKRLNSYPDWRDQIDKLWHDIDNGTLTNKSSGTLYLALKAVKDKYPKS